MLGVKVTHSVYGKGIIKECSNDGYITVEFANKTSIFVYPDAFENFLKAEDCTLQKSIDAEIKAKKESLEKKRIEKEFARKTEVDIKLKQNSKLCTNLSKAIIRSQRTDEKRMVFFVFQGNTFDREYKGGYIWAPIENKTTTPPHHWTRLLDVRKGDIILHGCNGYIQAISIAKDSCYECKQPTELIVEGLWDLKGRKVDCEYTYINNPIKTSNYVSEIIRLSNVKYSPFDKNGSGNMGYLFEINRELARIFVKETVKFNSYLKAVDYIKDFISE